MKVLVLLGHPRKDSYCGALSESYAAGALESGAHVKLVAIGDLSFEKNVLIPDPEDQFFESDLLKIQEDILWADHLVFVFPTWWGSMPGILKSFLDRVFTPRFAFNEKRKWEYEKLLAGKTAQLIITMDTPVFVYKFIYKAPGKHTLANSTLKFCGVSPVRTKLISPLKYSTAEDRERWLGEVHQLGRNLENGVLTPFEKHTRKIIPWLKALRLQFYPMTFIAYATGAYAARHYGYGFDLWVMIIGYLFLFVLEAATVFSNEYYDYGSDSKNRNYSPFNGGSRVLADKLISFKKLKRAISICIISLVPLFLLLNYVSPGAIIPVSIVCLFTAVLALGYTIPPLKLSWRGLGETDVAVTHSIAVMLCGFVFQGGNLNDRSVWLISIPLFFSIVPAIILSGVPDYEADKNAGKKTIPVRIGKNKAAITSIISVLLASASAVFLRHSGLLPGVFGNAVYFTIAHSIFLSWLIYRLYRTKIKPDRIDGVMVVSLLYIFWFGIIPLIGVV